MKFRSLTAALMLAAMCASSQAETAVAPVAAAVSRPGAEAFGGLPILSSPQLSPDGTYFACMQSLKGRPVVTITKIGDTSGKWPVALPIPKMIIDGFMWVKNDRLILRLKWTRSPSGESKTFYHYVAVTADGIKAVPLAEDKVTGAGDTTDIRHRSHIIEIADIALEDPNHVYALMSDGALARVNLDSGEANGVMQPNNGKVRVTVEWIMDGHGNPVARIDQTYNPLVHHLMAPVNGEWKELLATPATDDRGIDVFGLTQDGKAVVMPGLSDEPFFKLYRMELTAEHPTSVLFAPQGYDFDDIIVDERSRRVTGASYTADLTKTEYFDTELAAIQHGLEQNFPDMNVRIVSTDIARTKVFFVVDAPTQAPVYLFLNRTTHVAKPIGRAYPGLREPDLGAKKPYPYKARDGLAIPAYITLPPGKVAKGLPLIVMPHGGPDARDSIAFEWWPQFYANRGYAVFQPNYRGSSGYGRAFTQAGLHQWGLKMQDDITDGVLKLIADGIVDPKRICIVGASFGGYTALAGAAFTPDLYACAVSVNGVSDLPRMLTSEAQDYGYDGKAYSFWVSRMGDPSADSARLKATSPAMNAAKVRCPVMLIHTAGDTTVRIEQGEEMERALKSAGLPVEFVRIEGDDHYLELADTRIRILNETEAFLAKYIGN
jgi:dipeptidyl aminopeptidase/acylaminoacyl peptidase